MMPQPNVYDLVRAQAERVPDAIAIVDRAPVTYGQLMARTDQIANAIAERELGAEAPVAVLMPRDADLVATLLAVWKTGACYVPIDIDDPPLRQARMIDIAGCVLVVGTDALRRRMTDAVDDTEAALGVSFLSIDKLSATTTSVTTSQVEMPVAEGGDRLAYILFTSGSTGVPKGVEVEHRSVVNLLFAARDLLEFAPTDRYLAVSTIGFDISVAELFVPLISGGSALLRDRHLLLDPARFASDIGKHDVTVVQTGPNVWSAVLTAIADFPRIRVAISTGEAVSPTVADRLTGIADHVWNLYGPTEATVWATGHRLAGPAMAPAAGVTTDTASSVSAPIGVALDNVQTIVVDPAGHEVGAGEHGELWIGGAALARGYRDNQALTHERFVVRDGHRWYRTGDTVARDRNGVLHYFGRTDDQVKVRGVRIEPMEVESAILAVAGVNAAAATWFESRAGARSIVAAVVAEPDVQLTAEHLYAELAQTLPGPMIPSRFVFCEALPRSSSGKVDRGAIRSLSSSATDNGVADPDSELTATERELIDIWKRTLGIDAVAPDDHFFTIGGDSLAAVAMMLHVEETFATPMPALAVFEAPTLRHLAERIDAATDEPDTWAFEEYVYPIVEGVGTPFFFCGVDLKLARPGMWTAGCPLYAVSQWAQGKGFLHAQSVEDLALRQLEAITDIQPHGPYRLGGFSFGGIVAFELARLLRDRGETVELLFLLDATEPYRTTAGPAADDSVQPLRARVSTYVGDLRRTRGLRSGARDAGKRAMVNIVNLGGRVPTWQWLNYHVVHLYGRHPSYISTRLLPKDRWPAYWYTSLRLAKSYVAQPYDGPAAAVFLEEQERSTTWRTLVEATTPTIIVDDPSHTALFDEPTARRWLDFLDTCLAVHGDV